LFNEELALCTHIIQIPSSDLYTSLNLSHAVYVCTYEIFCAAGLFQPSEETSEEANSELRERMFAVWREMMIKTEFTQAQKLDHMMMGLRRIFARGKLTVPDVKILMGLAKQSIWARDQWKKDADD
jgi:tRNA/rRNA methyltransferase